MDNCNLSQTCTRAFYPVIGKMALFFILSLGDTIYASLQPGKKEL